MLFLMFFAAAARAAPLDGIWRQGCAGGYSREERFNGAQATYVERNFRDSACSAIAVETLSRGTLSLGDGVAQPAGARALDFTFTAVAFRPMDEAAAAVWNQRGVCGFRDWRAGAERDVTGRECDFFGLGSVVKVPAAGTRKFGVVKMGYEALYLGHLTLERDGATPEKRPRELDPAPYRLAR